MQRSSPRGEEDTALNAAAPPTPDVHQGRNAGEGGGTGRRDDTSGNNRGGRRPRRQRQPRRCRPLPRAALHPRRRLQRRGSAVTRAQLAADAHVAARRTRGGASGRGGCFVVRAGPEDRAVGETLRRAQQGEGWGTLVELIGCCGGLARWSGGAHNTAWRCHTMKAGMVMLTRQQDGVQLASNVMSGKRCRRG